MIKYEYITDKRVPIEEKMRKWFGHIYRTKKHVIVTMSDASKQPLKYK